MKSLIFVVVDILSINLTRVTQVESACGSLSSGKRINNCKKEYLKQRKLGALEKKLVVREDDEKQATDF